MNDASKTFLCGKKGGDNPEKMRAVIDALTELPLDVPQAWNGMLLVESIRDHVRFNHVDDMIAMFKEAAGSADESSLLHLVETVAEAIKGLALKLPSPIEGAQDEGLLCLTKLAGGLAHLKELGDDATADCAILADVLAVGPVSREKKDKALADLQHMRQDLSGYHGVLKGFLATEKFGSLVAWVESGVEDQESTLLCSQLKDSFQNLAKEDVPANERSRFDALLHQALSTMAGDQQGNVQATVKHIIGGLVECMNAVPNKLDDHVQEACALCDLPKAKAESQVESVASSIKVLIDKLFRRAVFDIDNILDGVSGEVSDKLLTKTSMADAVGMLRKTHDTILAKKSLVDTSLAIAGAVSGQATPQDIAAHLQAGDAVLDKAGTLNEATASAWSRMKKLVQEKASADMLEVSGKATQRFKDLAKEVVQRCIDIRPESPDAEQEALVSSLKEQEHKVMQVCAWSATPQLDKASVSCGVTVIGSICLWTKAILSLKEEPGKSFPSVATSRTRSKSLAT